LLGVRLFEENREVIQSAAERQTVFLRNVALGKHSKKSQQLLNEIQKAKLCLLTPEDKAAYDARLRQEQAANAAAVAGAGATAGATASSPAAAGESEQETFAWLFADAAVPPPLSRKPARPKAWSPVRVPGLLRRVPPYAWIAGSCAAAALVLGVVIYVTTGKGTVKIELSEPNAKVEVKVDGYQIDIAGLKDPLRLSVGEHDLEVTSGDFKTFTRAFTVGRGSQEVVKVSLEPKAGISEPRPTDAQSASAKRGSAVSHLSDIAQAKRNVFGYKVLNATGNMVSEFADYTNVVVDYSWAKDGDAVIAGASKAGLRVVLGFRETPGEESLQERVLELAGRHRDAVGAICWASPNYTGYESTQLSEFGRKLKAALPGVEFWCDFVEAPRGQEVPMPVPGEVDRLIVTFYASRTSQDVDARANGVLPRWVERANGRPVLLGWDVWDGNPPGLADKYEPGTIRRCAQVVRDRGLAGLIIGPYGWGNNAYQGVDANPNLLAEIKEVAKDLMAAPPKAANGVTGELLPGRRTD
jgi:hypothetical protein